MVQSCHSSSYDLWYSIPPFTPERPYLTIPADPSTPTPLSSVPFPHINAPQYPSPCPQSYSRPLYSFETTSPTPSYPSSHAPRTTSFPPLPLPLHLLSPSLT